MGYLQRPQATVLKCPKSHRPNALEAVQYHECALNFANNDLDHFEDGADAAEHELHSSEKGDRAQSLYSTDSQVESAQSKSAFSSK